MQENQTATKFRATAPSRPLLASAPASMMTGAAAEECPQADSGTERVRDEGGRGLLRV